MWRTYDTSVPISMPNMTSELYEKERQKVVSFVCSIDNMQKQKTTSNREILTKYQFVYVLVAAHNDMRKRVKRSIIWNPFWRFLRNCLNTETMLSLKVSIFRIYDRSCNWNFTTVLEPIMSMDFGCF